jgi:hypothetical protein
MHGSRPTAPDLVSAAGYDACTPAAVGDHMKTTSTRKLAFRRETVAALSKDLLDRVQGGADVNQGAMSPLCKPTYWDSCQCANR